MTALVTARHALPGPSAGTLSVLAVWHVLPGAVVLLGRGATPPPAAGAAVLQHAGGPATHSRGAFQCVAWPIDPEAGDGGPAGHAFLAAVRLAGRIDAAPGSALTLRAQGMEAVALPLLQATDDAAFGQAVAQHAGQHAPAIARFLFEMLAPHEGREAPNAATMLRAFLSQAAEPDGCIEIMAAVPDSCVVLQGWGRRVPDQVQVVLAGTALASFHGHAGEFSRDDIEPPATGGLIVLPAQAAACLAGIDHVFLLSPEAIHGRTLVEHPRLDPASSAGHIRHMLPSLRCLPAMQHILRDAVRPRYDGHDTLSGHAQPVRAAVDLACASPGVGAYFSGWMFDPACRVADLHLCSGGRTLARLDTSWTRVPRDDVSNAFRAAAAFPPSPGDLWGFAAYAPFEAPAPAPYLQVTFTDGDRAFLPLELTDPGNARTRATLLDSVDLCKPSGLPIVERQLAPFLSRVREAAPAYTVILAGPATRDHAIVVPLAVPVLPRPLLSGFLHEPLTASEHLVLVCGPEWEQQALDRLRALVQFHQLPATILHGSETAHPLASLSAAAAATKASWFLLASPGLVGAGPWRQALRHALQQAARDGAAFACPTLLYEDWSVRYAGHAALRWHDASPYAELQAAGAGLPALSKPGMPPIACPASIGTLACCLIARDALGALDGEGTLSTSAGREATAFMRLKATGHRGVWAASVQVYAPEERADSPGRTAQLVDGWIIRNAWKGKE